MTLLDLFLTPVYLLVFYLIAYQIKPHVTDRNTAPYFIPGLTVKFVGALALGMIYQFYYGGGDTFNFYLDSTHIFDAFVSNPIKGFKLLFTSNKFDPEVYQWASRIYFWDDSSSRFVVKIAGLFSLFSFNSYAVIACFFATVSYSGLWNLYRTFYRMYPHLNKPVAYAVLFVPSVFFWGSGYMKDTITMAAVGWAVYSVYQLFILKRGVFFNAVILLAALYVLYSIKIYILLSLTPGLILWVFLRYTKDIRNTFFRYVLTPFMLVIAGALGFYAVQKIGESNARYSLEAMSETAEITARWLTQMGELQGGSVYSLGDYDYSTAGMIRKAIPAINVTLFRPYVWETRNPVMFLSALESLFMLLFTVYVVYKKGIQGFFRAISNDPFVLFCLIFAISFSFAVGISTYNFGSLVRYKIPMLPFYLMAMLAILHPQGRRVVVKRRRKVSSLETTENPASTVSRPRLPIAWRS